MSYNQIFDKNINEPLDASYTKNVKFNNVRCRNINTTTINNTVPAALIPGANGQLLKTVAGVPTWQYFQLGDFSNSLGAADAVLTTNNTATQAAWSRALSIDSVNVVDAGGIKLNGIAAGAFETIVSDGLGNLGWQPIGTLPAGPNNSIYITDGLGVQQWSTNVITDNITVTNQFISTVDTNLDNVNIIANLDIAGISPMANQILGTDVGNVLGWQNLPPQQNHALYYCTASQNINFALSTTLTYVGVYNNLVGKITQTAPSNFTCATAGTYAVRVDVSCLPSPSENEITIRVGGIPQAYSFLNITSSFCSAYAILSLGVGDLVQIFSIRTNGDPSAKLNLANPQSSPLEFVQLA